MNRFSFKNKKVKLVFYILFIILNLTMFMFSVVKQDKVILFISIVCLVMYLAYLIRFIYKRKDDGGLRNE